MVKQRDEAGSECGDPSGVFRHRFEIPAEAIDQNGHVNNVVYVQWMQDVAVRHFHAANCADAMHAVGGTWVVRSHRIEYKAPAFSGDSIEAQTWVADFRRVRSLRKYRFVRLPDSALLAEGETDWVFVNAETGRPVAIPDEMKNAFEQVPSTGTREGRSHDE